MFNTLFNMLKADQVESSFIIIIIILNRELLEAKPSCEGSLSYLEQIKAVDYSGTLFPRGNYYLLDLPWDRWHMGLTISSILYVCVNQIGTVTSFFPNSCPKTKDIFIK